MRAPPAGRPTPGLAGDRPKERRAPTPKLDRCSLWYFLTSTSAVTCPRSVRHVALRRVGDQFAVFPFCLSVVVVSSVCGSSCFVGRWFFVPALLPLVPLFFAFAFQRFLVFRFAVVFVLGAANYVIDAIPLL